MSDYHAIEVSSNRNDVDRVTVAYHFDVPVETNAVGISLSDCIVQDHAHSETSTTQIPNHASDHAAENAELVAGTKIEHVETIKFSSNKTNVFKLGKITARFTALEAIVPDRIREKYKFWGYNGDVT